MLFGHAGGPNKVLFRVTQTVCGSINRVLRIELAGEIEGKTQTKSAGKYLRVCDKNFVLVIACGSGSAKQRTENA